VQARWPPQYLRHINSAICEKICFNTYTVNRHDNNNSNMQPYINHGVCENYQSELKWHVVYFLAKQRYRL